MDIIKEELNVIGRAKNAQIEDLKSDLAKLRQAVSQHVDSVLAHCSEGREFYSASVLLDTIEKETKKLVEVLLK